MAALTWDLIKCSGPTPADDTANHHRLWKNKQVHSPHSHPDSGTMISKVTFAWKEDFGAPGSDPVLCLLSPGVALLMLPLVSGVAWHEERLQPVSWTRLCVAASWCTDSSQVVESTLLDNPLKAVVIPVAYASFPTTLFPCSPLSMNMFWYFALRTVSPLSGDLLRLTLLMEGVSECLLDRSQVGSLCHHWLDLFSLSCESNM